MKVAVRIFVVFSFVSLAIIVDIFYFSLSFIFRLERSKENYLITRENLKILLNWITE